MRVKTGLGEPPILFYKAQLAAAEYERLVSELYPGSDPYTGIKTTAQKSLSKWTGEEWTTRTGEPAIQGDVTARYLPKAAWSKLSDAEAKATDDKKRKASRRRQFVPNTAKAKAAGRAARRSANR